MNDKQTHTYEEMAPVRTVKRIAFDVDGTLIRRTDNGDTPRYEIIQMLQTLVAQGHTIFVWSGGGEDYASEWARKLGLLPDVRIIGKSKNYDIDVCFDDQAVDLAKINVIV